jgi:predicted O-methyltransferase YrrM
MDAAKGQYIRWLPDILRLMAPGAVMLSDNVLQEGDLIESHYLVERRNRTIYRRMRDYLYELTHHPMLITSILPVGDGVALSIRQETEDEKA